jgi:hypothetical protein
LGISTLIVVVASVDTLTGSLVAIDLTAGCSTIEGSTSRRGVSDDAAQALSISLTILSKTDVGGVVAIIVFGTRERIEANTKRNIASGLSVGVSTVQNSTVVVHVASSAGTIGLTVGTSGESIITSLGGAESVGSASSLANLGVGVANGLSDYFTTIESSTSGAGNYVTAVQASSVGLAVSTAGSNAFGVLVAIFANTGITPRLEVVCSTVVDFAISSTSNASTASTVAHAVLSGVTVGVFSTRSRIFTDTSCKVAN